MPSKQRLNPTSVQVARRAGVSQSAVSRCFTPGASISAKTRQKVLKAADELGYQPNFVARTLVTKRSHLVAMILPQITNRYYPEVLLCLSAALEKQGLRTLLFTFSSEETVHELFAELMRYQVDGVIMAGRPDPNLLIEYRKRGVPIVLYNRYWPDINISSVACDHRRSAAELARRLYQSGRRQFGLITGTQNSPTNYEREQGFRDELARLNITELASRCGQYEYPTSQQVFQELLQVQPALDAIFCTNDVMAFAVVDSLKQNPQYDIAVVGFDDMTPAAWSGYQLTTVRQPLASMATKTVELLLKHIEGSPIEAEHIFMPGKIVVRQSALL